MSAPILQNVVRRVVGGNVWLSQSNADDPIAALARFPVHEINPEVLATEEAVGRAMFDEIVAAARRTNDDLVIILLGGRGAQALHKHLGELAKTDEADELLARLHVFTQDALAPMKMESNLSFVRDFERLLGADFFRKIKSFTSMNTETRDLEGELARYVAKLDALGGIDIFFLGHGPEAGAASHLAYIKPDSGARATDVAGLIPISSSILEHHISKFKAGGSQITEQDETECRAATHILTLGPAAILRARRVVQSIVDASTAPAKRASYRRVLETKLSDDLNERAAQLDQNPGLWTRLHPNLRSLILPDVLES
jgi:6-phosphogluconolactonase/glucosamine-6-phosphate isomerase/deaminase